MVDDELDKDEERDVDSKDRCSVLSVSAALVDISTFEEIFGASTKKLLIVFPFVGFGGIDKRFGKRDQRY